MQMVKLTPEELNRATKDVLLKNALMLTEELETMTKDFCGAVEQMERLKDRVSDLDQMATNWNAKYNQANDELKRATEEVVARRIEVKNLNAVIKAKVEQASRLMAIIERSQIIGLNVAEVVRDKCGNVRRTDPAAIQNPTLPWGSME